MPVIVFYVRKGGQNMKKILSLLLIFILLFLCVGCDKGEEPTESIKPSESETNIEETIQTDPIKMYDTEPFEGPFHRRRRWCPAFSGSVHLFPPHRGTRFQWQKALLRHISAAGGRPRRSR